MISWRPPHSSWGFSWGFLSSCIWLLLFLLSGVQAQDIPSTSPSNSTKDLAQVRFLLQSSQLQLPSPILLAPLTQQLTTLSLSQFTQFNVSGQLLAVDPSNSAAVNNTEIAFISCDPSSYPGVLSAGVTIANVIQSLLGPVAILLYSAQSDHCNYTDDDPDFTYKNVFTVLGANSTLSILDQLSSHSNSTFSSIVHGMSSTGNGSAPFGGVGGDAGGSSSTGSGTLTGASPTTAVAMIILYSITGIITALFLGIIVTGAIRAHRHPERYGPRNVMGRPRQSRARGLARAMLETIPIVKFGDSVDRVDAVKGDVEMADGMDGGEEQRTSVINENETVQTAHSPESPSNGNNPENPGSEAPPVAKETGTWNHEHSNDSGNNVCAICTDDFVKGQDVRVLPCNHQFHPECVDPWLVNVSGTCPLCRIDLNPVEAVTEGEEQDGDGDDSEQHNHGSDLPLEARAQHRGLSSYFQDMRRMRNASVEERIAALRRLRQSSEQDRDAEETAEENQNRRRSLTARLRERFRIRTRQHEDEPPALPSQPPSNV
ncbi:hypothetical protein VTN77DRAFT_3581 [Rasamsonia byssochlamydoides]|uniref:uncharacterized protein n=1 Tax=Rasamsonia byssochlamydoides TaxID=89139 RepID=UPI0037432818